MYMKRWKTPQSMGSRREPLMPVSGRAGAQTPRRKLISYFLEGFCRGPRAPRGGFWGSAEAHSGGTRNERGVGQGDDSARCPLGGPMGRGKPRGCAPAEWTLPDTVGSGCGCADTGSVMGRHVPGSDRCL